GRQGHPIGTHLAPDDQGVVVEGTLPVDLDRLNAREVDIGSGDHDTAAGGAVGRGFKGLGGACPSDDQSVGAGGVAPVDRDASQPGRGVEVGDVDMVAARAGIQDEGGFVGELDGLKGVHRDATTVGEDQASGVVDGVATLQEARQTRDTGDVECG